VVSIKINSYRYSELRIAVIYEYNLFQLHIDNCLRKAHRQISEPKVDVVVHRFRYHITRKDIIYTGKYYRRRGEIYDITMYRSGRMSSMYRKERLDQLLIQRPKAWIFKLYTHVLSSRI